MTDTRAIDRCNKTNANPLVSIIVNNYNYVTFLRRSIESALAQRYPHTEVVVVDDASTDGSPELIRSFGDRIVPVLKPVNGGQAAAMNAGFRACRGDVIIFLDADDYLYAETAETVARTFRSGVGLVQYRLHLVDITGVVMDLYPPAEIRFDTGDVTRKLVKIGRFDGTVTSGLAFARGTLAAILPIPEDRYRIAADGYLITVAPFAGEVVAVEQPLGAYRRHGSSLWSTSSSGAAGFRRSILHDLTRYEDLAHRCIALGVSGPKRPGLRDYQHIGFRLGSRLLDKCQHPMPDDSRVVLGLRGAIASLRAPLLARFRVLMSVWFLGLGLLPESMSRMLLLWRIDPTSRPRGLRSVIRSMRQYKSA